MRDGVKTIDSKTIEVLIKYIVKQLIIYFVYVLIKLVIGRSQTCGIIGWCFLLAPFRKTQIKNWHLHISDVITKTSKHYNETRTYEL